MAAEQTAQEQKAAEQRCKALTELDRQRKRRAGLQEKFADAQSEYTRAAEAAQAALAHYSALDRAYLDAQAGILARTLTPGQPCPVCGATEHPCPAAAPEQTPDAAARKRAKADSERAQRDAEARSAEAAALRGQLTAVREALETACAALTPPLDPETLVQTLPALQEKAAQDARGCAGRLAEQRAQLDKLQALADGLSAQEAATSWTTPQPTVQPSCRMRTAMRQRLRSRRYRRSTRRCGRRLTRHRSSTLRRRPSARSCAERSPRCTRRRTPHRRRTSPRCKRSVMHSARAPTCYRRR